MNTQARVNLYRRLLRRAKTELARVTNAALSQVELDGLYRANSKRCVMRRRKPRCTPSGRDWLPRKHTIAPSIARTWRTGSYSSW